MLSNWSLILNVLLLVGVMVAITRMIRSRRQNEPVLPRAPSLGVADTNHCDDIIAIRKVTEDVVVTRPIIQTSAHHSAEPIVRQSTIPPTLAAKAPDIEIINPQNSQSSPPLMMFLLAKANRQLAGYELLQALLAAGLRFGEGDLFHRHQSPNGQGTIMCSLAAATASGVFDLQNIGAFVVRGLCLFMQASGNPTIDEERFEMMLDTAKKLSEGLDTYLLDDKRQPLSDESVRRYHQVLNLNDLCEQSEVGIEPRVSL